MSLSNHSQTTTRVVGVGIAGQLLMITSISIDSQFEIACYLTHHVFSCPINMVAVTRLGASNAGANLVRTILLIADGLVL